MEIRVTAQADSTGRRRLHLPPAAVVVLAPALVWFALELAVGCDFVRDRWVAYEGTVVEVRSTWTDLLTLDFTPVEHLVIRTPAGGLVDRTVPVEELAHARVAPGDRVVKARGFGERVRVPGKPTVSEVIEAARSRLEAGNAGVDGL